MEKKFTWTIEMDSDDIWNVLFHLDALVAHREQSMNESTTENRELWEGMVKESRELKERFQTAMNHGTVRAV